MIDVEWLESYIEGEMRAHNVPGFALAIIEGDTIAYARGFGVTSIENPIMPVTPETIFCCGSISKSLTAATAMCMVERGMLDLDEPVVRYVPWLSFSRKEYAGGVTLRRLLSHSSGLFGTGANFGPRDLGALEDCIRETVPLLDFVAPPGVAFEYSSLGIDLAGYVIEVVGGKYFPMLVRELLLEPLDMHRTLYDRTVAMTFDVALPHVTGNDGGPLVQHRMFDYAAANPAGQAMASTRDLASFVSMISEGGRFRGRQVISADPVREMIRSQVSLRDAEGGGYGLGFYTLRYRGHRWITHGGMLTPYLCEVSLLPDEGLGVVYQCSVTNSFEPHLIRRRIFDDYLGLAAATGRELDAVAGTAGAGPYGYRQVSCGCDSGMDVDLTGRSLDVSAYAGRYFSPAGGFATIGTEDDHLVLERGGAEVALYWAGDELFSSLDGAAVVGFVPNAGSGPQYLMLEEHAYARFGQEGLPEVPRSRLESYVGHYRFEDGDTATAWLEDDALYLSLSWMGDRYRCVPVSETKFATDAGLIEFRFRGKGSRVFVFAGGIIAERVGDAGVGASDVTSYQRG